MVGKDFIGFSLTSGALAVAAIEMGIAAMSGAFIMAAWSKLLPEHLTPGDGQNFSAIIGELISDGGRSPGLGLLTALLLCCMAKFYLGFTLVQGVSKTNTKKCYTWCFLNPIVHLLALGTLTTFPFETTTLDVEMVWYGAAAFIFYIISSTLIVYNFTRQIKEVQQ